MKEDIQEKLKAIVVLAHKLESLKEQEKDLREAIDKMTDKIQEVDDVIGEHHGDSKHNIVATTITLLWC